MSEEEEEELLEELGEGEQGAPSLEEQVLAHGRDLMRDDDVIKLITQKKKEYRVLIPGISHMNRTSNTDPKTARLCKLYLKRAMDLVLLTKDEKDMNFGEFAFIDAMNVFCTCAMSDMVSGWRGRLVTEVKRILRVVRGEESSGGRRWKFW